MIHQLAENGTAAIVLPHGALFRSGGEGTIREYLIKDLNFLDAVIGLPANLFYGTSIPACILVMKKCRVHDDNIYFIDASADFIKAGNQNALTDEHVEKIVSTYARRTEVEKYAHVASMKEISKNGFNLNIPRYVDSFEGADPVDLGVVTEQLKMIETDTTKTDELIQVFCAELGIKSPF